MPAGIGIQFGFDGEGLAVGNNDRLRQRFNRSEGVAGRIAQGHEEACPGVAGGRGEQPEQGECDDKHGGGQQTPQAMVRIWCSSAKIALGGIVGDLFDGCFAKRERAGLLGLAVSQFDDAE